MFRLDLITFCDPLQEVEGLDDMPRPLDVQGSYPPPPHVSPSCILDTRQVSRLEVLQVQTHLPLCTVSPLLRLPAVCPICSFLSVVLYGICSDALNIKVSV